MAKPGEKAVIGMNFSLAPSEVYPRAEVGSPQKTSIPSTPYDKTSRAMAMPIGYSSMQNACIFVICSEAVSLFYPLGITTDNPVHVAIGIRVTKEQATGKADEEGRAVAASRTGVSRTRSPQTRTDQSD